MNFQKHLKECRLFTSAVKKLKFTVAAVILSASALVFSMAESPVYAAQTDSTASGYYRADDGTTGSVSLQYPVSGAEFSIYLVGSANEDGGYTLAEPFSNYNVNLTSSQAAATLADYVQRDSADDTDTAAEGTDQESADEESADEESADVESADEESTGDDSTVTITPLATAKSDKDGNATFTGLKRGVYLILGGSIEKGGWTYTASPVLFELPNLQKISGSDTYEENWNLTIGGKYEKKEIPVTPEEETTLLKVLKVWKSDDEDSRPESVTVQLLCNGKLSDREDAEVVLNKENGWTYEWTDLAANQEWSVVEKEVPDGYTVSRTKDGTSIVITNTKKTPSTPDNPSKTDKTTNKTTKLPQTGQLWWPVTVLIAIGLFLILIGLLLRPNERQK